MSFMFLPDVPNREGGFLGEFLHYLSGVVRRSVIGDHDIKRFYRLAEISREAMAQRFCTIECVDQDADSRFMSSDNSRVWRSVSQVSNFNCFLQGVISGVNLTCPGCESRL